jgi:trimeric autotransporter adhesin
MKISVTNNTWGGVNKMRMNGKTEKKLRLVVAALVACGIGIVGCDWVEANGDETYYDRLELDTKRMGLTSLGRGGYSDSKFDRYKSGCFAQTLFGADLSSYGGHDVLIGTSSVAYEGAVAVGFDNTAYQYSVAIGYKADAGYSSATYSGKAVAIGYSSTADYFESVAIGAGSSTTEANTVSVGSRENKRKIMYVADGLADSDATTFAQIKTDADGSYIKKSLTDSTTLNAEGTVGKNLTALDSAIGVVTVPTTVSSSGRSLLTASTGKLYVLGESLNEDGSLKTSVSDNLIKLDQKIGEITSNYGILSNDNTISQNLMALEAAIAKANQTLDFSNPNGTAPTNGTTNGVTNGVTNGDPQGTTNSDTTKSSTTIYSNDGKPIATLTQGSVTKGDTGFVSGGQVWNADMAAGQSISLSDATHTVNGKNIGANQIASNDGTVLATFQKMKEVSSSDNGFVSGSDLYNEVRPEDGKYVKNNSTTGDNLNALDDAVAALDKKTEGLISTDDGTGTGSGTGSGDGTSTGGGTIHIGGGSSATNVTVINIAKDDGTARTFTGVADGVNDYDAVNMRQYNALSSNMRDVAAGAAALAALHPGTYDPTDKMSFAVGFGHYKDANAGALGAFYRPNADTLISFAGTVGNGDPMLNVGFSFKLGERGLPDRKYVENSDVARVIDAQDKKIVAQEKTIQLQTKEISALKADNEKMKAQIAQILKKLELSDTVKKTAAKN